MKMKLVIQGLKLVDTATPTLLERKSQNYVVISECNSTYNRKMSIN